jgi:hypothetical protein
MSSATEENIENRPIFFTGRISNFSALSRLYGRSLQVDDSGLKRRIPARRQSFIKLRDTGDRLDK